MKTKIFIFSSLLCLYGTGVARASDCVGADCDIAPIVFEEFEEVSHESGPVWDMPKVALDAPQAAVVPEHNIKLYSVKPTVPDNRPALWDGTDGKYKQKTADKTVIGATAYQFGTIQLQAINTKIFQTGFWNPPKKQS